MPVRSPPAPPVGVRALDRRESLPAAACDAPVPSERRGGDPAAPSLSDELKSGASSAPVATSGLGYVPVRSPPAGTPLTVASVPSLPSAPSLPAGPRSPPAPVSPLLP